MCGELYSLYKSDEEIKVNKIWSLHTDISGKCKRCMEYMYQLNIRTAQWGYSDVYPKIVAFRGSIRLKFRQPVSLSSLSSPSISLPHCPSISLPPPPSPSLPLHLPHCPSISLPLVPSPSPYVSLFLLLSTPLPSPSPPISLSLCFPLSPLLFHLALTPFPSILSIGSNITYCQHR